MSSPATTRIPFWDNAKFAAIALVIVGHAIVPLKAGSDIAEAFYYLVNAFHMPAFALVSGYFSRAEQTGRHRIRVFTDLVVPYVIFEAIARVLTVLLTDAPLTKLTASTWATWFLIALAIWRIVLPYLAMLRFPLVFAVLISLGVGFLPDVNTTFALRRTLGFLPFFILGWWLKERGYVQRFSLDVRRPAWVRGAAGAILLGTGVLLWWQLDWLNAHHFNQWIWFNSYNNTMAHEAWWGALVRLGVIAAAVLLAACFFALLPTREVAWTRLGEYTMYAYLLHIVVVYPIRLLEAEGVIVYPEDPIWIWLPVICALCVALTFALTSRPVRWATRWLVEPRVDWLFRR
ncbi:acyltransferase family protein [Microbacterium sp. NPDC096154]|uniref:acyltransferase family protein n=1 Tax=Microbacterium sp. NPDC096154 TaxID=3155549 RepID=UPI0033334F01